MSLELGVNFRATSGYVTDGANETYCLGDVYPVTRGGATFGWEAGPGATRDRSASIDRRLAGENYVYNVSDAAGAFRLDLPATGDYEIGLGVGGAISASTNWIVVKDDTTALITFAGVTAASGAALDAAGTSFTDAAWPAGQVHVTKTFASTILRVSVGVGTDDGTYSRFAHVYVKSAAGGGGGAAPYLVNRSARGQVHILAGLAPSRRA